MYDNSDAVRHGHRFYKKRWPQNLASAIAARRL
jgi:hypothetical protein